MEENLQQSQNEVNFGSQIKQAQQEHFQAAQINQEVQAKNNYKTLSFVFFVNFCTNLMINFDHGILPAATVDIRSDLNLTNIDLGILGSLVYLGLVIGSLFAMPIYSYCNAKLVIITCLLLNTGSLFLFTLSNTFWILCLSRFLVGFFQVFCCIYFPVWVDLFGPSNELKTTWLTLLLLGVTLGVILGYIITAFLIVYIHWQFAFYLQSVLIIPLALFYMFTPARYIIYSEAMKGVPNDNDTSKFLESLNYINLSRLSSRDPHSKHYRNPSNVLPESYQSSKQMNDPDHSPRFGGEKTPGFTLENDLVRGRSESLQQAEYKKIDNKNILRKVSYHYPESNSEVIIEQQQQKKNKNKLRNQIEGQINEQEEEGNEASNYKYQKQQSTISRKKRLEEKRLRKVEKKIMHFTLCQRVKYLLSNMQFLNVMLGLTFMFFFTTGIQFWATDYYQAIMHLNQETAYIYFTCIAISGPVLGVLFGGYIFNFIGGYNDPKALPLAVFMMSIASALAFPVVFFHNIVAFNLILWTQFFCGGFTVPVLTGILLNTVPPSQRTLASSLANLVYNLFGYLPAPFAYGLVYEYTGGSQTESRWGLFTIQAGSFLQIVFLFFAWIAKCRQDRENSRQERMNGRPSDLQNDPNYPLLSRSSDEPLLKKKQMDIQLTDEDEDEDPYEDEAKFLQSFKTPTSDRLKLESMSVFYSKGIYPTSLGMVVGDNE